MGHCPNGFFCYTIKKGETPEAISKKHKIGLDALLAANPYLDPANHIAGQTIVIPPCAQSQLQSYTLGEDEGLFDVLRKFSMDLKMFCTLNPGLNPLALKGGQRVNIWNPDENGKCWDTVRQGEDIVKTAKRHGVRPIVLLGANENLRPSDFVPGIKIKIPLIQS